MNTATCRQSTTARPAPVVKEAPLQPFLDLYLRNHVAQLSIAKEMTGTIRRYFVALLATPLEQLTPIQIEDWFHQIGTRVPSMAIHVYKSVSQGLQTQGAVTLHEPFCASISGSI